MDPIVNLEETPGKVVGRIRRRSPAETLAWINRQVRAMGIKLPYPKGVHRFKTHEEANSWEWNHMMAAAVKKRPVPQTSKT
jgi:hypothetical protein